MSRQSTQKVLAVAVLALAGFGVISLLRGRSSDVEPTREARSREPSHDEAHEKPVLPAATERASAIDEGLPPPVAKEDRARTTGKSPTLVLRRPWFDRYPKSRKDEIELWWFSSAGIGIHDKGSMWRSATDLFDFERQGQKLDITFFQDKKKEAVSFEVVACDESPPFDLCLDLKEPLRGKKRLYSFDFDDEMDQHIPWARDWRAAAESRARASR